MKSAAKKKACSECGDKHYLLRNNRGWLAASVCKCYRCERCNGGGRIYRENEKGLTFVEDCSCSRFKRRLELLGGSGVPGKFVDASFENYDTKAAAYSLLGAAKHKAEAFSADYGGADRGLVFMGPPGLGKTHLAVAIVKVLILEKGVDCKFVDFFQMLSDIRHGYSQDLSEQEVINPYIKSEVLVIDELAKGRNTEWELTILDQIITSRYNAADKFTLFTTNYLNELPGKGKKSRSMEDTESQDHREGLVRTTLQERIGDRIYSRLAEMCRFVKLEGKDHRQIKLPVFQQFATH